MLIRLGLLDTDFRYINKLADYFGHHYNREVEVRQFSDSRTLMDSLNRHERLDVLLASPDAVSDPASLPAGLQFAYLAEDMRAIGRNLEQVASVMNTLQGQVSYFKVSEDGAVSVEAPERSFATEEIEEVISKDEVSVDEFVIPEEELVEELD